MDGAACTVEVAVVEDVPYLRRPYEGRRDCHDCATPTGALHHPGCDMEDCPRCLGQAISCGCRWSGDPEREGPAPRDEHEAARRT